MDRAYNFMNDYARWSGDTEGLIEVPGGYTAKCDGGGGGRFWISPACRHRAIGVGVKTESGKTIPQAFWHILTYYSITLDHFRLIILAKMVSPLTNQRKGTAPWL